VWFSDLCGNSGASVDLSSVLSAERDAIAEFGFDAVWFMGVRERSPACIAIANQNKNLVDDFPRAIPDYKTDDDVGPPYCLGATFQPAIRSGRLQTEPAKGAGLVFLR